MSDAELLTRVKEIIDRKGRAGLEKAKAQILQSNYNGGTVNSALKYFVRVSAKKSLPVFPALLTLSCEACGGSAEEACDVGASLVLIAWAADIHDDVIDKSLVKYGKKTVYGKYGSDVALLAGDALLIQGYNSLYNSCASLNEERRNKIMSLVPAALFEVSQAEAKEVALRKKPDLTPKEVLELLRLKAAVPILNCRIGGILGNGNEKTLRILGEYGEAFGIVSLMIEEFMDLMDYEELVNRIKNEYLPLPTLYALQDFTIKREIMGLVSKPNFDEASQKAIAELTTETMCFNEFKCKISSLSIRSLKEIKTVPDKIAAKEFTLLLQVIGEKTL
jgi:geranylgeranyl pyrophosphate synthase